MNIMSDQEKIVYLSRFEVKKLLKASEMGKTFLGFDLKKQSEVVIKSFLTEVPEIQQKKIEQESLILKQVSHPAVAPFVEFGVEHGHILLIFSYISGETLESALKRSKLSIMEALSIGKCLLNGLDELHNNHLLHRNIRPSNVILHPSAGHNPGNNAILSDSGLSQGDFLEEEVRRLPLSTVRSLAPEQTGLLNFELSPASDLYSLGILLFEILLGKPLFDASDVSEVLRQQLTHNPIDLVKEGIISHRSFNDFLQRLVRKDPAERYQSAHAALKDLVQIENSLQNGNAFTSIALGRHDIRNSLTLPAFVSREKELQSLMRILELTLLGHGGLIFMEANSGGGKTRLIEEFSRECAKFPVKTIYGQGVNQVAPEPLQIFRILIEELIHSSSQHPQWIDSISKKLGPKMGAICDIFPQLEQIFGRQEKIDLASEAHGEMRSIPALSSLLDAVGNESQPAVIILDDFQWADHLSMKVLEYWWSEKKSAPESRSFSLIIASFQTEKVNDESILRKITPSRHYQLAPFGAESTKQLLESMAGPLRNEIVEPILQLSDGNPFFAISILQGMVESGTLVFDANEWEMGPEALPSIQSSRKAVAFLSKRLTLLPQETRNLLEMGAILGKRFDSKPLSVLAHQTEEQVYSAVKLARDRHIIWERMERKSFAFVHDKLREAILENIESSRRKELHLLAGKYFEDSKSGSDFDLSYHFDAADASEIALPYAIQAAEKARSQYSLEIAEFHYRIATKGVVKKPDIQVEQKVKEALAETLMLEGFYQEAKNYFEEAYAITSNDVSRAEIFAKLGELAFKQGSMQNAGEALEKGLSLLGQKIPKNRFHFLIQLLREMGIQAAHTLLPYYFLARKSWNEQSKTDLLAAKLYDRLAYAWFFHRGLIPTLWAHLKELNLVEKYPPSRELGQAYSSHTPVMCVIPLFKRAEKYGKKGLEIRRALHDLWGEGQSLHFYGAAFYTASQFQKAQTLFREAIHILERTGDRWEVNGAVYHLGMTLYHLGDLKAAADLGRKLHHAGLAIGDSFAAGTGLNIWSKATQGNIPTQSLATELKKQSDDQHRNAEVLQAEGIRLISEGAFADACATFQRAWQICKSAGLKNEYVASIPSWLAISLRFTAATIPIYDPSKKSELMRSAYQYAKLGVKIAQQFRNHLPLALRELAMIEASFGNWKKSMLLLYKSLDIAKAQEARYQVACTLMARSKIGLTAGWPQAGSDLIYAQRELAFMGVEKPLFGIEPKIKTAAKSVTLSLVDRFDNLLEEGRSIASALSEKEIYHRIHKAALNLLRVEECILFKLSPHSSDWIEESLQLVHGHEKSNPSKILALESLKQGKSLVFTEGMESVFTESLILSGAKSVLCSPIFVRGKITLCLYLTHHQISQFFSNGETKIAEFLCSLSGAALENAEGFKEVEALSNSLRDDIFQRKQTEEKLQNAIIEKEVLLKEVYHRTKNNMQVISSLLNLQASETKDKRILEILKESQNRIRSLSLIHEKLYCSKDLININLKEYTKELALRLLQTYLTRSKKIDLIVKGDDIPIEIDSAIPFGLAINEIISNSLKYAFSSKEEGIISVNLRKKDNQPINENEHLVEVIIQDNGIGLPENLDFTKTSSLGMRLIFGLIQGQLHGKLEYLKGPGTGVKINFSPSYYKRRL